MVKSLPNSKVKYVCKEIEMNSKLEAVIVATKFILIWLLGTKRPGTSTDKTCFKVCFPYAYSQLLTLKEICHWC